MKRRKYLGRTSARLLLAVAVIAATSAVSIGAALADTVTPPPAEIPPTDTDFSQTVSVAQFDPALGTLISRTLTFTATVTGSMGVENTSDASGSDGDMELSARLTVARASDPLNPVTVASPAAAETFALPVFDGTVDFGGTSGLTFADINDTQTVTDTSTDPAILALVTGTGTIDYIVDASGTSFANGTGGNIATFFASQAGATITITYEYQPPVEDAPAIDIEKSTNGVDADTPEEAVQVDEGDAVTWEYVVTNTGNVDLTNVVVTDDQGVAVSCPQDTLAVGEIMTCTGSGTAVVPLYANIGTVTGTPPDGPAVTDSDPSHYTFVGQGGGAPAIQIIKDPPLQSFTFPNVPATATWTITVTNTSDVPLVNVEVTDALAPACDRVIGDLAVGASTDYTCTLAGIEESLTNVAVVTGESENGVQVTDQDDAQVVVELPPTGARSSEALLIFGVLLLGAGAFLVAPRPRRHRG